MKRQQTVEITRQLDVTIIAFKATSISNVEGIAIASQQIRDFIAQQNPCKIVFDFSRVKFFTSQVLGILLDVRSRLKACDGQVVISGINPQLHRVFKITNLDKIFSFFPDGKSAVEHFNQ